MISSELQIDWLYRLKKRILLSILMVLATTIVVTMIFIAYKLRETLVNDSKLKTRELAVTIDANLHHLMILRAPEAIQETLEILVAKNPAIVQAFILNNQGKVTYSSEKAAIGTVLDRYAEASCRVCHAGTGVASGATDAVVFANNGEIHRNISVIYNEKSCHECHDPAVAINGKLIIDRSLESAFTLINTIELILFCSGVVCLLILVPLFSKLLSRGIDHYILEIFTRNEELRLLYVMVERLSKTLDMHLLKDIVIEIFKEVMAADEMVLILPRTQQDYSASSWTSASGKVERRKIAQEDPEHETLQRWLADKLKTITVSDDARQICIPIERGGARLALVLARKGEGHFDKSRLRLSTLISSHIAVAFDNARLYYIAITDELTKTFTKRHFRYCIDNAFADYQEIGNKFALLMMDLDKFKQVNDTYGHVTGDKVLQQLGDIIRQSVREEDLVFRYGGEEFAVILPATDGEGAKFVAERIRTSTESAVFESGTIDLKLTISVGLATCPDAPSVHALVVAADKALYAAKHQGRNRLVMADNTYELST